MRDADYEELSKGLVDLADSVKKHADRLDKSRINHQRTLEEMRKLLRELHDSAGTVGDAFQMGRRAQVKDREETFDRIDELLKETEIR